ncbi:MAG: GspE/PulE family protein [Thermodesulfobacteriota bacterium]|nr:GspE/PulE family protein [Thermodesulfobacteriota bacterium]
MTDTSKKKPLGVLLKENGIITEDHISYALRLQKLTKEKLGEILERMGFVTEFEVVTALACQEAVPYVDTDEIVPRHDVLKLFNKNLCLTNNFLPMGIEEDNIKIAANNPSDPKLHQLIRRQTGRNPVFYIAERNKIINAINTFYYFLEHPVEQLIDREVSVLAKDTEMARNLDNLINHILHLAVKSRATDIHIQSMENSIDISFRVDGVMIPMLVMPVELGRLVTSIKMKAEMDIAEQRLPQDGRFRATILNKTYDFRVSTIVSPHGENVAMRVLPTDSTIMGMQQLGFFDNHIQIIEQLFKEPFGIILLTGPTGSGKTTTLYAGIKCLNLLQKNLITVEDPIEYNIPLIRQTQVNDKAGYTFASAVRYFLRHDPDIILVGEIRDKETATTAFRASTTGHLVLSTLHTNSAIGAIPRLKDLGIHSYLIADSLLGVVSQRLVRKVCNACKEAYVPAHWEKEYLGDPDIKELYRGSGCEACVNTGYLGRTLVYEFLTIDHEVSLLIEKEADLGEILAKTQHKTGSSIFDITVKKVKMGITTTEEALRTLGNTRDTQSNELLSLQTHHSGRECFLGNNQAAL